MSKIINITDKFSKEEASIQIGEAVYPVDSSVEAVMKFEELAKDGSTKALLEAIKATLGEKAFGTIGVMKLSVKNLKVLTTALLAAMQEITYEEAAARFQQ